MKKYHHRKLPDFSTLLSGHSPQNDLGFQSTKLQIWYNNSKKSWVDNGETPHKHLESDECFIVLSGTLIVAVEEDQFAINPGEFCFFPAGVYHNILEVKPPIETLMIRSPSIDDKVHQNQLEKQNQDTDIEKKSELE